MATKPTDANDEPIVKKASVAVKIKASTAAAKRSPKKATVAKANAIEEKAAKTVTKAKAATKVKATTKAGSSPVMPDEEAAPAPAAKVVVKGAKKTVKKVIKTVMKAK